MTEIDRTDVQDSSASSEDEALTQLGRYLWHCRALRRDVDQALVDEEYRSYGNEIVYAADFSEIYSYVLPAKEVESVAAFEGLEKSQLIAINNAILTRLFFEKMGPNSLVKPVVLLPPYRVELLGSRGLLSEEAFVEFGRLLIQVRAALDGLRGNPQFMTALHAVEQGGSTGSQSAASAKLELLQTLITEAPLLTLMGRPIEEWSPARRLHQLLDRAKLVGLTEILRTEPDPEDLDQQLIAMITDRLMKLRKREYLKPRKREHPSAARLDAQALAYLVYVNDHLRPSRRLVLVSRSETMHHVFGSLPNSNPRWKDYLRRPRAFGAIAVGASEHEEVSRLDGLRRRRDTLDSLLDKAEAALGYVKSNLQTPRALNLERQRNDVDNWRSVLDQLRSQWIEAHNLIIAETSVRMSDVLGDRDSTLAQIVNALKDHHHLDRLVSSWISGIAADIDSNNLLIAELLGRMGDDKDHVSYRIEAVDRRRGKYRAATLVWSSRTFKTFSILFYNERIRSARALGKSGERALEKCLYESNRPSISSVDLTSPRRSGFYERYLAAAFLSALLGDWHTAESHCNRAIDWPELEDSTPRHEAYYFRTLCRSRNPEARFSFEHYRDGMSDLEEATRLLRLVRGVGTKDDPRYLFERGVQTYLGVRARQSGHESKGYLSHVKKEDAIGFAELASAGNLAVKKEPSYDDVMIYFEEALKLLDEGWPNKTERNSDAHKRLRLDITNAICYFVVEHRGQTTEAIGHFRSFMQAINSSGMNDGTLPISALDTKYWATWKLKDIVVAELDWVEVAELLTKRLNSEEIMESGRRDVLNHIEEFRRGGSRSEI